MIEIRHTNCMLQLLIKKQDFGAVWAGDESWKQPNLDTGCLYSKIGLGIVLAPTNIIRDPINTLISQ